MAAAKVPVEGVPAICSVCQRVFPVSTPPASSVEPLPEAAQALEDPPGDFEDLRTLASEAVSEMDAATGLDGETTLLPGQDRFGRRDPEQRARHLARVLVSDIIAYDPARSREALSRGTFREDFQDEIHRSWEEYVDQVGSEMAESTPFFDEALHDLLAEGRNAL